MTDINPFVAMSAYIPVAVMQIYIVVMALLVISGTLLDVSHKKSAKYFFEAGKEAEKARTRQLSGGEKSGILVKTIAEDVLTSAEFCNPNRRIAHLLTMYGFVVFVVATVVLIFSRMDASMSPGIWPMLWHLGALAVCIGGYWFWFFIRVDVAAEGNPWYRVVRADLFILSLLATTTFALIWSLVQSGGISAWSMLFFALFILSSMILFGGVLWSKFAHMFFKPAAAYQKRIEAADGSDANLPPPADAPAKMGLGIKRELPRHY